MELYPPDAIFTKPGAVISPGGEKPHPARLCKLGTNFQANARPSINVLPKAYHSMFILFEQLSLYHCDKQVPSVNYYKQRTEVQIL